MTTAVSLRLARIGCLVVAAVQPVPAQMFREPTNPPSTVRPPGLKDVGIDQKLDNRLPLDLHFRDESGRDVRLGDFFSTKPVIITPVYYGCPMLCTQILNGLVSGLKPVSFNAGQQYDVLAVSFDPSETPELALKKKDSYVRRYGRAGAENGFHFLTGDPPAIKALTDALGFRYSYDPKSKQFAHASGLMVATPEGRISRYLYGVDYAPRDLRLALVEAAERKIGTPVDELLLFCYHYDPATGKYGAIAMNFLRLAAAATVLGIGVLLTLLFRHDLKNRTS
ncbi:MAG TPA: SCO family protein [Bryobacteraceae bacterium]|jgi:protein SCO1/2|nr:SCO family protein [Bryobacteraceae bacterium]